MLPVFDGHNDLLFRLLLSPQRREQIFLTGEGWKMAEDGRRKHKIVLGDGGNDDFNRAIRAHANAANTKARGFSIWTTKGQTASDALASSIFQAVDSALGKTIQMRQDRTDGDHDYEENFFVLRNTRMPSVLIETLFFDNLRDAELLNNPQFQRQMADAIAQGILNHLRPLL